MFSSGPNDGICRTAGVTVDIIGRADVDRCQVSAVHRLAQSPTSGTASRGFLKTRGNLC